ncbi:MAG TPA: hypothetical protein VF101_20395 [Gaiellaceae bacterium]
MKRIADRHEIGREAPIVVSPWAFARMLKQLVDAIRGSRARRRR